MKCARVQVIRVPRRSTLGIAALELMDSANDSRLTQDSLNLYRADHLLLDEFISPYIVMVAIANGEIVGMTAGLIQDDKLLNSITVVRENWRKRGIGSLLMKEKAAEISWLFPDVEIATKVAQDNVASMRALLKAGYIASSEGMFTRKGVPVGYFMFEAI